MPKSCGPVQVVLIAGAQSVVTLHVPNLLIVKVLMKPDITLHDVVNNWFWRTQQFKLMIDFMSGNF